ncbi:MAG: TRAP transporter substrate-binding protein [Burkholderiaceae bacterium]
MNPDRRRFAAASSAAALVLTLPGTSRAQQEEIKLATFVPPTHYGLAQIMVPWGKEIAEKSGGRLNLRVFPSMQLGGKPPELYKQMVRGLSDITFTLPGYTSADFPLMSLSELPGMATSSEEGTRKMWQHMKFFTDGEMKESKPLVIWTGDAAAVMTRSKPVRRLEDMKGMKIRTPSSAQSEQLIALGATPIDMPAGQIYNSIERGVVDGALISMAGAIDFKLLEVCRHFTIDVPVGRSPFTINMNLARYQKLPADLRKIIDDTTGLGLSLRAAANIQKHSDDAVAAARRDKEVIALSADEQRRWTAAFVPMIRAQLAATEKPGVPARDFLKAYGMQV